MKAEISNRWYAFVLVTWAAFVAGAAFRMAGDQTFLTPDAPAVSAPSDGSEATMMNLYRAEVADVREENRALSARIAELSEK